MIIPLLKHMAVMEFLTNTTGSYIISIRNRFIRPPYYPVPCVGTQEQERL